MSVGTTGRRVLITGAAQGLGHAMARKFAEGGDTVFMVDVRADIVEVAAKLAADTGGASVRGRQIDVTSVNEVAAWIDEVDESGGADVLINNAGIIRDGLLENISDEDWRAVVDVSLTGAFHCNRAVVPGMKMRQRGRIISFASMSWRGNYGQSNYVAAKAGIVGMTRGLALEVAKYGITVNAIAPGLIETPMLASMDDRAREKLIGRVPLRHTGDSADIANTAAFLASEDARYITGVVLDVDGGIGIGSSIR
jgi:3-oxoacyl-[acyl-carrier protein] reductase